ncbi:MAG: glutamate synthase small subunit [Campylobacteraceae bacterium 4484_4]|nr:MAG: glutamate synthase small subunit [Campylobacteraceae bacterium 4484_4]
MQNFIFMERIEPEKRGSNERKKDFKEIYTIFRTTDAMAQADRCVQCGDPYCHSACPLHNFIPYWLKSVAGKDDELAFKLSNETNPFPEITGRICPQDRLCEGACTLEQDGYNAVTIGSIETYISEHGFKKGMKVTFPPLDTGKKVAIVGSGPAGFSAATYLMRAGIAVDMFEKANRPGGLLTYGIPSFKLEKEIVFRRFQWLEEAGMKLYLNTEVGKDIDFKELMESYDAVFIGIGAEASKKANVPGENGKNVFVAIDFLKNIQQKLFGEAYDESFDVRNKNVVVVGGGDTAMDCLRTSLREGARSVKCLYRRDAHNMPGSRKEFKNAKEEGAEFLFNVTPKEVLLNDRGEVIGIEMLKTILTKKDATGRQRVEVIENSEFRVDADVVIFALGFNNTQPKYLFENGIEMDKWGQIQADENMECSKPFVYTGGDCYRGSDLVVTAAYDGKIAAESMVKKLLGK